MMKDDQIHLQAYYCIICKQSQTVCQMIKSGPLMLKKQKG
uniref:Uncharacterized protein n=1 Tax=Setaria italica TaxID=4555 RepID=K3YNU3_SETIT